MSTIGEMLLLGGGISLQLLEKISYRWLVWISCYNVFRKDSHCSPETPAVIVGPTLGSKSEVG
jgi:hypothetical protein